MSFSPARNIPVLQGEFAVSDDPNTVMTTVLGSCVSICLYDPQVGVGGMNHFLLPGDQKQGKTSVRFGAHAVEVLINELLKKSARRENLEAKVFGGATIAAKFSGIGQSNADFARRFLAEEGIRCVSESLGGSHARRLRFWPALGKAQQMIVPPSDVVAAESKLIAKSAKPEPQVTLF